ncbi:cytochrome P450 [Irpex rosettiformis]|uniref:Cytochrome P450 n=1 Tax=Irpex rosettiformis TaxID=378272 RepID=A0ACB8TW48_9APHY|nr:cytochrome P450 [Irpex rosettiformis]
MLILINPTRAVLKDAALQRKPPAPYPPGPKGLPIVGNMFDMPPAYPWHTFTDWGKTFGDIIYLNVLGQPTVILNSAKQATSLLDKKSSIYSDRPVLQMGGELVGWNNSLAMMHQGHRLREYRRYIHQSIGSKTSMEKHHGVIVEEDKKSLRRMLESNEDIAAEIRKTAGAIILRVTYGYTPQEDADPMVMLVEEALETFAQTTAPGAWLVDILPSLRHLPAWMPGAGFKKVAADMREVLLNMGNVPYQMTKQKLTNGLDVPSNFVAECLDKENLNAETEHNIKWAAGSLYSGGADTTVSSMHTFILAMTLYPEVQKRAQAEIDLVVGNERLPSFEDRAQLPFVEALIKEVLRWRCVAPLGLPHRATEDDIHDRFLIKKGTTVFVNIWGILHDPEIYPNPDTFDPSRFVSETGEPTDVPNPYNVCFGYGRRICPGMNFADASVFLWSTMVLAVFDISKAVGSDGKVIVPAAEHTSSVISHPKPFKCLIVPRSEKARRLILSVDE